MPGRTQIRQFPAPALVGLARSYDANVVVRESEEPAGKPVPACTFDATVAWRPDTKSLRRLERIGPLGRFLLFLQSFEASEIGRRRRGTASPENVERLPLPGFIANLPVEPGKPIVDFSLLVLRKRR